jgi:hypothetical protein
LHRKSRIIIVAVQVGAMKIYVAAVEVLWEKERRGLKTNSVYHKN